MLHVRGQRKKTRSKTYNLSVNTGLFPDKMYWVFAIVLTLIMKIHSPRKMVINNALFYTVFQV